VVAIQMPANTAINPVVSQFEPSSDLSSFAAALCLFWLIFTTAIADPARAE